MRIILILWALPMGFFWGWYLLSLNDLNFGTIFLSRDLHDIVFRLYGQMLGVPAGEVPGMVAGACAFDTAIVLAIAAWRWRKDWYPQTRDFLVALLARPADAPEGEEDIESSFAVSEPIGLPDGSAHPAE